MPYSTEWKKKGVHWTFTGIVTGREILQVNLDAYGDKRFDDLRYQLVDFSEASSFDVTETEVKVIAFEDMAAARSNPRIKVALVAPQGIIRKLSEFYARQTDPSPWETKIFDTVKEAKQWLKSLGLV